MNDWGPYDLSKPLPGVAMSSLPHYYQFTTSQVYMLSGGYADVEAVAAPEPAKEIVKIPEVVRLDVDRKFDL